MGEVAKQTKARRHQATVNVNMASIKRKVKRLTQMLISIVNDCNILLSIQNK